MNHQTQVTNMKVRTRAERLMEKSAQWTELPERETNWGTRFLKLDRLARNLAVVGGLVLVLIAVRNSSMPEAQSVFSALQENAGMQWDESVGKLSFVNSLLPEEIQEVWNETPALSVYAPVNGDVVHTWSPSEPYLLIQGTARDVRASADGEVMSIAHGLEEERILRVRHDDGTETLYGNLQTCYAETGDRIRAGDIVGVLMDNAPLAFEVRVNGRSVDPAQQMKRFTE